MDDRGVIQCVSGTVGYAIWHIGQDVRLSLNDRFYFTAFNADELRALRTSLQNGGWYGVNTQSVGIDKAELTTLTSLRTQVVMNEKQVASLIAVIDEALSRPPLPVDIAEIIKRHEQE